MKELTVQAFMEEMQAEGYIINAFNRPVLTSNGFGTEPKLQGPGEEIPLVIMTSDEDRRGTILDPRGCITDNFSLNPIFLWEHGMQMPLHDSVLGRINGVTISHNSIIAQAEYVELANNMLPKKILEMELNGLIPGNSMGWFPVSDITIDEDGKRHVGKWELLEVSKVQLPVNGKATNRQLGQSSQAS